MMQTLSSIYQALTRTKLGYSLKNRMAAAFLLSSLITFALVSSASYYTITQILYSKIEKNIQLTLDQISKDIDLTMDNLISVSGQLSYGGIISNDLINFLSTNSYSSKRAYVDNIDTYLSLIDHTNPNAGLHFYYNPDSKSMLFANAKLNREFSLEGLPTLTGQTLFTFYGPHRSFEAGSQSVVLSLSRPVDRLGEYNLNLYLESNVSTFERSLKKAQFGMDTAYVLVNDQGNVVYSELVDEFPLGSVYQGGRKHIGDKVVFDSKSRYGWELAALFDRSVFDREIRDWAVRMIILGIGLMCVSLLAGYLVWRAVYVPIRVFKKEIGLMASSNFDSSPERTNVAEFDQVLKQFHLMKDRIQTLLQEVKQQEINKRQLEVDKLLSQINPHFLYNTLNTVQWLARAQGQGEIVKLVANLTRLLRYNLGKEGSVVTVERELSALKDYVALQLVRHDQQFEVRYEIDDGAGEVEIPRFILQPLVENAIYHGLKDREGVITVRIEWAGDELLTVSVRDNGAGLSDEQKERLLAGGRDAQSEAGLGIGLNYVNKMLEVHYGEAGKLTIDSMLGEGTVYRFTIRANIKEGPEDGE
ncbi:cache domain-containing sensor histidine kinase [Paenibacillus thermotolerans]|uniref:cache domain-containing sensor histidine kinase n=1 Tax=Paenibacillus thermotolerans TaxID=3027807 RepID=UPI002368B217|nr:MULTISPECIES: sensor histidine kinase [unclassified Paenibacillus]